jgi:hypothetical protein
VKAPSTLILIQPSSGGVQASVVRFRVWNFFFFWSLVFTVVLSNQLGIYIFLIRVETGNRLSTFTPGLKDCCIYCRSTTFVVFCLLTLPWSSEWCRTRSWRWSLPVHRHCHFKSSTFTYLASSWPCKGQAASWCWSGQPLGENLHNSTLNC